MRVLFHWVRDYIWLIIAVLFIALTTYSSHRDVQKQAEQKAKQEQERAYLAQSITPEQAEQINVWMFDQPELEATIEMYSEDGKITNEEYTRIEDAYRSLVAKEKIPKVIR